MPTTASERVYELLLENLPIEPKKLLEFKLPRKTQRRVSKLLALNQEGQLGWEEREELERFLAAEVCVRVLKSKALAYLKNKKRSA